MFLSTYLPVNMRRKNCAVYSNEKVFPESKLLKAYDFITNHPVDGVYLNDGNVAFLDSPDVIWTYPEIYLAYEAYNQAAVNNFSFYSVKDEHGIPQLFISKAFKGHRILVNAFTMHSVLLGNKQLVNKAANLIDKTSTCHYCVDLFNTLQAIELGSAKFLPAVLVMKDQDDEYMAVSPLTTLMSEMTTEYASDLINEFKQVRENKAIVTESVKFENDRFVRTDLPKSWQPMSTEHIDYIISTYDKIREKKSNYVALINENYETELFFSTNYRYLVNAKTFECVVIKNQHTKSLLIDFASRNTIPTDKLQLAWMLAKTE